MGVRACRLGCTTLLGMAVAFGCVSKPSDHLVTDGEHVVREKFAELQSAIKSRDTEQLWALLDARSRADAERAAKNIQTAYNQAEAAEKANQEKELGLSGTELAGLDAKGFLKTKRFQKRSDEVPDSKIDKVVVQGDSATVHYLEADGEEEKAIFVRQEGQWKAWLTVPKVSRP